MYCQNCGKPIGINTKFCPNCGIKVEAMSEDLITKKVLDPLNDVEVNNDTLIEKSANWSGTPNYQNNNNDGILINGVVWALYNLDGQGKFDTSQKGEGFFWGKKLKEITCPLGWRLPTKDEFKKLLDVQMVDKAWTDINGLNGCRFTSKATGASLFLPAAGVVMFGNKGLVLCCYDEVGYYLSSTTPLLGVNGATYLYFDDHHRTYTYTDSEHWCSVRCVKL